MRSFQIIRCFYFLFGLLLALAACTSQSSSNTAQLQINTSQLESGKILFAAHHSNNPNGDLKLFIMAQDGSSLTELYSGTGIGAPDIEALSNGGWRFLSGINGLSIYDTEQSSWTTITNSGATRGDFNSDASSLVFQADASNGSGSLDIWKVTLDGSAPQQLTTMSVGENAEWPNFNSTTGAILFFSTSGLTSRYVMNGNGTDMTEIPLPGGGAATHIVLSPDGLEFLDAQTLTSYKISTGETGTIDHLKTTTTMMNQLLAMGYEEVPAANLNNRSGKGAFALSVDWSRDGKKLVFDALVQEVSTDVIAGIGIFVYDIDSDQLILIYGPELFNGSRTNNFNYSLYTPKWIP